MATWRVIEVYEIEADEEWMDLITLAERAEQRVTISIRAERR